MENVIFPYIYINQSIMNHMIKVAKISLVRFVVKTHLSKVSDKTTDSNFHLGYWQQTVQNRAAVDLINFIFF